MFQNLLVSKEGGVTLLQFNRPQKKNAFNARLRQEMEEALKEISADPQQRVVIVTGGEEFFCAGADIGEILEATTAEATYRHAREFQLLFDQIEALPQPVVAAVAGYALGGGCELALACDFRVASETAKFGLPEIKIGAFPAGGGTQRLPRLIGAARAKEVIFTGEPIDASDALTCGLVSKVVAKDKLHEAAKKLVNRGLEMDIGAALELEACCLGTLAGTHDLHEGTLAFLEKRKPNFTGH